MTRLKQRRTDKALGRSWPPALREVTEGDPLSAVQTQRGVMVTSHDPQFVRTMANANLVIARFRRGFKALADA